MQYLPNICQPFSRRVFQKNKNKKKQTKDNNFVLSTIPLINMIKDEKRITGHITKRLHPVKVQSYADDTTIIINLPRELKYIMEILKSLKNTLVKRKNNKKYLSCGAVRSAASSYAAMCKVAGLRPVLVIA